MKLHKISPAYWHLPLGKATVYTQVELPSLIPLSKEGNRKSSSLSFLRGELGWGKTDAKTLINQLFQTSVYTEPLQGED